MHMSQRTGLATWLTTRSIQFGAGGDHRAVAVGQQRDRRVADGGAGGRRGQRVDRRGHVPGVERARHPQRPQPRALAGGFAANSASCSRVPPATICPAVLTLAGVSPASAMAASTAASSPPSTAVIPVGSASQAAAIASPRTRVSAMASSADSTPAIAPAASSPTLCPAAASGSPSSPATASAAATSSGWATEVSVISSALPVVPSRIRSRPASSDQVPSCSASPGSSSHGDRKPGVCAPCPGAVKMSTLFTLPCRDPPHR